MYEGPWERGAQPFSGKSRQTVRSSVNLLKWLPALASVTALVLVIIAAAIGWLGLVAAAALCFALLIFLLGLWGIWILNNIPM